MAGKRRVKCANCGMTYDLMIDDCTPEWLTSGRCPSCKSNAYDKIPIEWKRYD